MRKQDIRQGVVYAYQRFGRHPTDPAEPIVFLGFTDFGGGPKLAGLWQDTRGFGRLAFKQAHPRSRVQPGTAQNEGAIGYPAVLLAKSSPEPGELEALRAITLAEFKRATNPPWSGNHLFLIVTSLGRVTGLWKDQ